MSQRVQVYRLEVAKVKVQGQLPWLIAALFEFQVCMVQRCPPIAATEAEDSQMMVKRLLGVVIVALLDFLQENFILGSGNENFHHNLCKCKHFFKRMFKNHPKKLNCVGKQRKLP